MGFLSLSVSYNGWIIRFSYHLQDLLQNVVHYSVIFYRLDVMDAFDTMWKLCIGGGSNNECEDVGRQMYLINGH